MHAVESTVLADPEKNAKDSSNLHALHLQRVSRELVVSAFHKEHDIADPSHHHDEAIEITSWPPYRHGWSDEPGLRYAMLSDMESRFHGRMLVQVFSASNAPQKVRNSELRQELFEANTYEDVLEILHKNNLDNCVHDYLSYLELRQEDLEDGESPGVILQSLQSWAWFLIDCAEPMGLPYAEFNADFDGCVELEWRLSGESRWEDPDAKYWGNGKGIAVLRFYPSLLNAFSILSGPYASEKRRITFEGCLSHTKTKEILSLFSERFLDAED